MFKSIRYLAPILCLALLGSTSPAFSADPAGLKVATFQSDVTPPVGGHPLIWLTSVEEVEDPLLAKGIVLDDGKSRYVICSLDWCGLCNSSYDLFRDKIAAAAKTEVTNVTVHSIHQHTAPYTDGDAQKLLDKFDKSPAYVDFEYMEKVSDEVAAVVGKSLGKLEAFDSVGIGQGKVDRVASTRRIPIEGGKVRSRMSSCTDPELRALTEGRIDPMLKTVTLARGDKPLVRLHYYTTHPQSFYGDPRACTDVPGFARERLQEKEGVFQIYFTGCAGDVAMGKYNDRTKEARTELTDRLYAGMEAAVAATEYGPARGLEWRTVPVLFPLRDDPGYSMEENQAKVANLELNPILRIRAATRVAFSERIEKPVDLSMLQIGPATLVHLPGESMIEFQFFAQGLKPNDFVAVAAYSDVGPGYICTEKSFSEGGYEPTASRAGPKAEWVFKDAIRKLME